MLSSELEKAYTDFHDSAFDNPTLDPKTSYMVKMAVSMAIGCYPWMDYFYGVAGEVGVTEEEIGAVQAIAMAVSAARVRAQFREVQARFDNISESE